MLETMQIDEKTALPASVAPVAAGVRKKNEFRAGDIFPFRTWKSIPSLSTVVLNLSLSAGTLVVSAGGLLLTLGVFLPISIFKTLGGYVRGLSSHQRGLSLSADLRRRCIVITGASSGIGAALALEYAAPDAHIVLIARDDGRLKDVAAQAESQGATIAIHSIDLFEAANTIKLERLLQDIDAANDGIDIAIACASVTGHRADVLGEDVAHVPPLDDASHTDGAQPDQIADRGDVWGATTASRMLQVNVAANQEFILRSWELMKARTTRDKSSSRPSAKIIVLSSSTAFFTPASFALYAASKAYLYSLSRSLQIASVPYNIGVITVTPGFMETGLTATMSKVGATFPKAILGDPRKLARKIRRSEEKDELVVLYPVSQVWSLYALRGLNPLVETFGMWLGAASGVAAWFFS